MVRVIPFSVVFFIVSLGFLAFVFSKDDPYFQMLYFLMLIFFVSSSFVMYLFFNSYFGRTWQKIVIYENGIQFPNYLWDRIKGRESFLAKVKIVSVKAWFVTGPNAVGVGTADLSFQTSAGKIYHTGSRISSDISSFSDWLKTNWQFKVEEKKVQVNSAASARKVPVVRGAASNTCLGCGYSFTENIGFCPSCGRITPNGKGQIESSVPERSPVEPQTPVRPQSVQSYPYQQPLDPYAPPYQNQYGQALPPNPQYQNAPPYQNVRPDYSAPQQPYPSYGQYQYQPIGSLYGKNPRTAMLLAALGLLGMMGFGHIYMKKFIKGFMLFFVGGFLALMSLASIYLIFQPSQFSLEVNIVTAAIFSVPFLILLVWQLFDAPKPPRSIMRQDTYGNNRPPYGP